jgi:diguanylate cyclase (GGDEF)-like protein
MAKIFLREHVERFLILLVAFIAVILLSHTLMTKVFQDIFFLTYMDASCTSGSIFLTLLYITAKFNKPFERRLSNYLYFKSKPYYKALLKEAITDGLTDLYDHRYFVLRLDDEIERAKRYKRSLSLLMMDIDHFKRYNDTFGHLAGDDVLIGLAKIFKKSSRRVDTVARYGGEEFVITLPETKREGAALLGERIRKQVEKMEFEKGGGVTVSIGVGSFDGSNMSFTKEDLIKMADDALYKAKRNGRNRVEA